MSVFKEAKLAYRERKAEIIAERNAEKMERATRRDMAAMSSHDETRSSHTSRSRTTSSSRPHLKVRPPTDRHHSSSSVKSPGSASPSSPRHRHHHRHRPQYEQDLHSHSSYSGSKSAPTTPAGRPSTELIRRHTAHDIALAQHRPQPARSNSTSLIDMDLAYGEYHPASLRAPQKTADDGEIRGLVAKVKMLLDEANCAQHSVTAMIAHLQKNPDAMAAVALTLAEISNVASKMAPGALTALKGSAPAVFALLASPEFLIAAGVGVGVTIVMLGGYKIIKKIKAKNAVEKEGSMDEMMEIGGDASRIESWRRGIADVEASSVGTSVEGELITPMAAGMRGMPVSDRVSDLKSKKSKKNKKSKSKSEKSEESVKSGRSSKSTVSNAEGKQLVPVKVKKPSPLRLMFK